MVYMYSDTCQVRTGWYVGLGTCEYTYTSIMAIQYILNTYAILGAEYGRYSSRYLLWPSTGRYCNIAIHIIPGLGALYYCNSMLPTRVGMA